MNNRAMTLAVVIALFAVYLVFSWVTDVEQRAKEQYGNKILVLKAKRDIKETEALDTSMVEWKDVPQKFLEPGAITPVNQAKDDESQANRIKDIEGTIALVPIKAGEQISYSKISEPGIKTGLSQQIAPGRRAISVQVNEVAAVSKLVKLGDRVDVLAVIDLGGGKENKIAKTILQDVVVLSVGQYISSMPRLDLIEGNKIQSRNLNIDMNYNTVTLEVDPNQAQMLVLVANNGDNALSLSLRRNDDTERSTLGTVMLQDVLGGDANRARRPAGQQR